MTSRGTSAKQHSTETDLVNENNHLCALRSIDDIQRFLASEYSTPGHQPLSHSAPAIYSLVQRLRKYIDTSNRADAYRQVYGHVSERPMLADDEAMQAMVNTASFLAEHCESDKWQEAKRRELAADLQWAARWTMAKKIQLPPARNESKAATPAALLGVKHDKASKEPESPQEPVPSNSGTALHPALDSEARPASPDIAFETPFTHVHPDQGTHTSFRTDRQPDHPLQYLVGAAFRSPTGSMEGCVGSPKMLGLGEEDECGRFLYGPPFTEPAIDEGTDDYDEVAMRRDHTELPYEQRSPSFWKLM